MTDASPLYPAVSEILFRDWDPIGVNSYESARDEYDSYVAGIVGLLLRGADEHKLASELSYIARVTIGLSSDEELHRRVARRLRGLLTSP